MCGITGVYAYGREGIEESVLISMRDTMTHRGPDGVGAWISENGKVGLAHTRLSIVDLDTTASQPMTNEDGKVWVTFNGEIYNHLILRKELISLGHTFRTDHSDTEVLIHGFEQWGMEGLLERLDGDFAFAIWDGNKKTISLGRDRVGVKPLYFSLQDGLFLFGSEIKAILKHPAITPDVDPMAMYHYLSFLTTPAPMTMFEGINKLPAGYCIQIDSKGDFKAKRYWDAVPGRGIADGELEGMSEGAKEDYYIKGIRQRLGDAVDKRMMADVPVGVFLSGGVDSSTNVAMMSEYTDKLNTFTVGFKDFHHLNELDYAKKVANKFNTQHHEVLIDEKDMVGYLDNLIHHQDEPIADWVCIPLYFVSKLAHDNGVSVIQVGEGADEQFSGYAGYMSFLDLYHKYWKPFRTFVPKPLQHVAAYMAKTAAHYKPGLEVYADIIDRAARNREHFWSGATVFWDIMKDQLVQKGNISPGHTSSALLDSGILPRSYLEPDTFNIIQSFLGPFDKAFPKRDALTRMIYNEFKLRLPELLLMRVDKIAMSVSLEARVPFLDHRLVEFTMDIPEAMKVKGGMAKYLLKKGVEDLIPHEIIYRKKMGFGAPMAQWLRGDFGKQAENSILHSNLLKRGFFNLDYIKGMIKAHREERRDNSLYIWTLFNLTAWYDYWVEGIGR